MPINSIGMLKHPATKPPSQVWGVDRVELHVDHIKPKELGGKAVVSNGQTLCSQHNMLKKNLNQTEIGKKMFIRFYELANERDEWEISHFCEDILEVYEKHKMDSHIRWNRGG